jgi:hypothetical protein
MLDLRVVSADEVNKLAHDSTRLTAGTEPGFSSEMPLLVDTHVHPQYGHSMSKVVQTFVHLARHRAANGTVPYSHLSWLRNPRPPWPGGKVGHVNRFLEVALNGKGGASGFAMKHDYLQGRKTFSCYERLATLEPVEVMISCRDEAKHWYNFMSSSFPNAYRGNQVCPRPRVVFLGRSEGVGLRGISNRPEVLATLVAMGLPSPEIVTLSSRTSVDDVIRAFNTAGLIISSHSSQLKGLAFAANHTAVLELRAGGRLWSPWGEHIPFSDHIDSLHVHYAYSYGHLPDLPRCNDACLRKYMLTADYAVDTLTFQKDIRRLLREQEEQGPG